MPRHGERHGKCDATWDAESGKWKCRVCGDLLNPQGLVGHFNFSANHENYGSGSSGGTESANRGACQHTWRPLKRSGREGALLQRTKWTHVCTECGELGALIPNDSRGIVTEEDLA